ncbi:MAG: proline--tRNA ligase, partial [bacterium]
MHLSNIYFKTHKEMPKDASMPSHSLLLKAGLINMSSAGIYTYMPLMQKVMMNIECIIKEEMNRIGGQEMLMPALTPAKLWKETGRWDDFGDEMFRLKDRNDRQYALCPTHEEVITDIARDYFTSYRQLPQIWYQIQIKFRDEPRPRSGLLRVRQFEMKDSYSFDRDNEGLELSYSKHRAAYERIFDRCSIDYTVVEAASGLMGGGKSEEFMAPSDSGEDEIFICEKCGYSANSEVARTIAQQYE